MLTMLTLIPKTKTYKLNRLSIAENKIFWKIYKRLFGKKSSIRHFIKLVLDEMILSANIEILF